MKYLLIAGEASGDKHGARLMKGLLASDREAVIHFRGGSAMKAVAEGREGWALVGDCSEGAVMGVTAVLSKLPLLLRELRDCRHEILSWKPDAVILIDYPGFNLRIARFAARKGFRTFYYIAPKLWASRPGRIRTIKSCVERLYVILPFEKDYFASRGVDVRYFGNPLVEELAGCDPPRTGDSTVIALLPGSRKAEIESMMPVYMLLADSLHRREDYSSCRFLVSAAPGVPETEFFQYVQGRESYVSVVYGKNEEVLRSSRAAVVNSGTASLEAALLSTPQVLCYKTSVLTYAIGRAIIRVPYIGLCNLILNKEAVKELIQNEFTVDNIIRDLLPLIDGGASREHMLSDYQEIVSLLGEGHPSEAVAGDIVSALKG